MMLTKEQIKELLESGYSREQIISYAASSGSKPENEPELGLGNAARFALGQGLAFGFGDELEAAARAPFSERTYPEIRDEIRTGLDAAREAHPVKTFAAEIAGGALSGGAGAAKAAASAAGRNLLARATLGGMGIGAAQGVGSSRGGIQSHLEGGLVGAGLGGALGAGGHALARGVTAMGPKRQAGKILQERLAGRTPEQLSSRVRELGPTAMVADASPQMQAMSAYIANRPGPTEGLRTILQQREMNKTPVIDRTLRETMDVQGDPRALERAERIARREQAQVDYDELLRMPVNPTGNMLDELKLNKKSVGPALQATRQARKNADMPWKVDDDELIGTAGFWDFFSREMRDRGTSETGIVKASGVPYLQAADRVTRDLDPLTDGALGLTRDSYRIASEGLDAFKQAEKFMSMPSDEALDLIAKLDPNQRRLFAAGVTRTLANKLERSPETANQAWNAVKSTGMQRKMRALLGDDAYDSWRKQMEGIMEQSATYRVANTGSRTAPLMQQESAGAKSFGMVRDALQGNYSGVLSGVAEKFAPKSMSDKTAQALQRAVTAQGADIDPIVRALLAGSYPGAIPGALAGAGGAGLFNQ